MNERKGIPPAPAYITKLRQQREAAKVRSKTRDVKSDLKETEAIPGYDQPKANQMRIMLDFSKQAAPSSVMHFGSPNVLMTVYLAL